MSRVSVAALVLACVVGGAQAQQQPAKPQQMPSREKIEQLMGEGCKLWGCTTDAGALAKMTPAERTVQKTLAKIPAETTVAELEKALGPVFRGVGTPRPVWLGPDKDKDSQIAIYIKNNKIALIRWLKLRQWLWERAPSPAS